MLSYFSWKDHLNTCNNCLAWEYVPKKREVSAAIPINEDDTFVQPFNLQEKIALQ
jgi:hypothetical protein